MKQFNVTGMSCAACSARVEKAVNKLPNVTSCSVSLLTNSMGVEGDAETSDIIRAVEEAGYGASEKIVGMKNQSAVAGNTGSGMQNMEDALADKETPVLKKRLFTSLGFLIVLMYFSMGHMMWNFPVPVFFAQNHVAMVLYAINFYNH